MLLLRATRSTALVLMLAIFLVAVGAPAQGDPRPQVRAGAAARTVVRFDTVEGSFDVELYGDLMPRTAANFLVYVEAGRYDGSVVHRNSDTADPVLRDFVIQGGGFFLSDPEPPGTTLVVSDVATDAPINDEPGDGVAGPSNLRGTIAMAKSGPDAAISQWFINQGDNSFLDDPQRPDGGFSAFGVVLGDGMKVVDTIGDLPLPPAFGFTIASPFNDLPLRNFSGDSIDDIRELHTVVVHSVSVVPEPSGSLLAAASLATLVLVRVSGRRKRVRQMSTRTAARLVMVASGSGRATKSAVSSDDWL